MAGETLGRLDVDEELHAALLPFCRLAHGGVWTDPAAGHRVGVLDASDAAAVARLMDGKTADLAVHDPPYNIAVGQGKSRRLFAGSIGDYLAFSRRWVRNAVDVLSESANFYVWLGADQNADFQPLPEFMLLMRDFAELRSRSFITMRNQRGYGTQKNWMSVRQELLYYVKGEPFFQVVYTDIPKKTKGYYKDVGGKRTENLERGRSETVRPGNVWVDIQQVFYRLPENVSGAYAQKPLAAIERIVKSSSRPGELVTDFFAHAGTTLLACERLGRVCRTADIDPVYAELAIRRLEHYRATGKTGWGMGNPFPEVEKRI